MYKVLASVVSTLALAGVGGLVQARDLVLPTIPEATNAIADMFAGTGMPRPSKVKLGTCIASDDGAARQTGPIGTID